MRRNADLSKVPVYNSSAHFLIDPPEEHALNRLNAEEVLTQRAKVDPSWNREIPQGSLVAVPSTVTLYSSNKGMKGKLISFNLLADPIIALPRDE